MTISEGVKEVTGEMIKIQHLLRRTSPSHKMSDQESRLFSEAICRAEQALKRVAGEASPR
jgi:hypothetical protein